MTVGISGKAKMPHYDQQAIDTMAMVLMYQQAFKMTSDPQYVKKLFSVYSWFLGENSLCVPLYDEETKGCLDGLHPNGMNHNQGAESTLAYLISHLAVLETFELSNDQVYNRAESEGVLLRG